MLDQITPMVAADTVLGGVILLYKKRNREKVRKQQIQKRLL